MNAPHPSDLARLWRAARHWPGLVIALFGVLVCAAGMVICLLRLSGWMGPAGLTW